MGEWMNGHIKKLAKMRSENQECGGSEKIARQKSLGKLTARERINKLLDPDSFDEIGSAVRDHREPIDGKIRPSPAEGIVMGFGKINSRPVLTYSFDFTVMSGSLGDQAVWKLADLIEMAGQRRMPVIGMIDSAGERLSMKDGDSGMNGLSTLLRNCCNYSGMVPKITLLLGPCTGLLATLPVLSDFLIINEKNGFLWLGGPIETEEAGTAEFEMESAGQCDLIAIDDEDAIEKVKVLLSYLPQSCWSPVPNSAYETECPATEESLLDIMPDDVRQTYDIHEVIDLIVDPDSFFELKGDFASNLVIGFARFAGRVAGIVANNPDELSGILEPDSSDKYDRFMNFLNAFNIPLLTLVDTTAFPPGDRWERIGVIRHGAKLLHSYSHLTCPKITMVLRRSYGGANIVLGCSKMFPDFVYTWPTAEFAPTGPETVVHAVFHKELAKAKEAGKYEEVYNQLLGILREQFSVMNLGKHWTTYYTTHEIIDPRETRKKIINALQYLEGKSEHLPRKKRFIKPA